MIVKDAEELALSVAQFVQSEGALETYYMYDGEQILVIQQEALLLLIAMTMMLPLMNIAF